MRSYRHVYVMRERVINSETRSSWLRLRCLTPSLTSGQWSMITVVVPLSWWMNLMLLMRYYWLSLLFWQTA